MAQKFPELDLLQENHFNILYSWYSGNVLLFTIF